MKTSMMTNKKIVFFLIFFLLISSGLFFEKTSFASTNYSVGDFSSIPLNVNAASGTTPQVIIAASNDHELFFKAYDDDSDVDGDGIPDTTYKNSINYYGYYDSYKCYTYNTTEDRFEPKSFTTDKYCWDSATDTDNDASKGEWSGNFLNWVSMSRIDAVRKILFGGHRRVDTATETVLERAYLPHDAHSWAKYYDGADLKKLTPFSKAATAADISSGSDYYYCDQSDIDAWNNASPKDLSTVNTLCKDSVATGDGPSGGGDSEYFDCTTHPGDARCSDTTDPYNYTCANNTNPTDAGYTACKDVDVHNPAYRRNRNDYNANEDYDDADWDGTPIAMKKVGITLGNTTDVDVDNYGSNVGSEQYTEPPLIKTVRGNYSLWGSNERWQITWGSGPTTGTDYHPIEYHSASNGNDPQKSLIPAYSSSPDWSAHLGEGDYVARVQACVAGLIDDKAVDAVSGSTKETCYHYYGADGIADTSDDVYKPEGLLQKFGLSYERSNPLAFGMVAGSYRKHAHGGVIIQNVGDFSTEVDPTNGTFPHVAEFAVDGGLSNNDPDVGGLINAWSLYRIIHYNDRYGYYNDLDNCKWGLSDPADVTADNACENWGNPVSEIYYQAVNYYAGGGVIGDYRSNSSSGIPGLPVPQSFKDPLNADNSCAKLNIINFNTGVPSYDADDLDSASYGPSKLWDPATLPGDQSSSAMTDQVGKYEGIDGQSYFIGEIDLGSGTDDQLCTAKTITDFGTAGGVCPYAPRLSGSYRIAGLAYYAHIDDIRSSAFNSRELDGEQVINTYSIELAPGTPVISVPDPSDTTIQLATIIPACRNTSLTPNGNCTLVDFKIISQTVDAITKTVTGKVYIDWDDSEQGGDFDQDMWGILSYSLDKNTNKLSVTTQVEADSTPYKMAFGYTVSGTTDDGFHAHSGINGYKNSETAQNFDCSDANGCNCRSDYGVCNTADSGPSTKEYTLGSSPASLLKDPLWYAAKYGGFVDSNGNNIPDLQTEWDNKNNATGEDNSPDGIPDNYYYATNPQQLEDSLAKALADIAEKVSSGTAAAVVSSNVSGEGALFQAYYEPLKKDTTDNTIEARWLGTLQALWLDSYGNTRQDCSSSDFADANGINPATGKCETSLGTCTPNGILDNYCVDQVVEDYYDDFQKQTRVKIFTSDSPDIYSPYSMQGVVSNYSSGAVTMVPYSMEGIATYTSSPDTLTITPYSITGVVTSYDATTGTGTMTVATGGWTGPDGESYSAWQVTDTNNLVVGYSASSITLQAYPSGSEAAFTVSPAEGWISVGDTLEFITKNAVGTTGYSFDNWHLECLAGAAATADLSNVSLQVNNTSTDTFTIASGGAAFATCTRAKLSTYNLKGISGDSKNSWTVQNLSSSVASGESTSSITLANYGTKTFGVTPTVGWLAEKDNILISNYQYTTKDLYKIGYIWNARKELYLTDSSDTAISDSALEQNRNWSTPAGSNNSRYIMTWVDKNLNGIVDSGEYIPFTQDMFTTDNVSYTFFDVADEATAKDVINYVRGVENAGDRNRTIHYSTDDTSAHVMRLGDIINSTPAVVPAPQEGFNLLYNDLSYLDFRNKYINRRNMIYVGGNDGLLHAFNGGFYTQYTDSDGNKHAQYSIDNGAGATQNALGSEMWAYAPYNLLPHLQWLRINDYGKSTHVYYIDGKPRVFDAKIFTPDSDHPDGWGTVLVVGMSLGGGEMDVQVDQDKDAATPTQTVKFSSAYIVFDVTNPEEEPDLLGEIPLPDKSFTTVYPAVVAFQDVGAAQSCQGGTVACNKWYLLFGNGPKTYDYTTDQTAKAYFFDLDQLISGTPAPTGSVPTNCSVTSLTTKYNLMVCDTKETKSFVGTPDVVDWNLDFRADNAYFGLIGQTNAAAEKGSVWRFDFQDDSDIPNWSFDELIDVGDPVTAQPMPSIDNNGNHWIYFGTGRYFSSNDKLTTDTHYLYGVKDPDDATAYPLDPSDLLDVSNVEVYSDGTLDSSYIPVWGSQSLSTFEDIESAIDGTLSGMTTPPQGWRMSLPLITGSLGDPTTRGVTRAAILGGDAFFSVYQPSSNPCEGEGLSRLYGLYYKTGTGFPDYPIFGTTAEEVNNVVKYRTNKFVDLGTGFAAAPAIHSGKGSGGSELKVFTQLSTGNIVQSTAKTVYKIRTGRTSWREK